MNTKAVASKTGFSKGSHSALIDKLQAIQGGYIQLSGEVNAQIGQINDPLKCNVVINDKRFFELALSQGVLGITEAYLQKYWDVDNLVALIRIFSKNRHLLDKVNGNPLSKMSQLFFRLWYWRTRNNKKGSARNIAAHYDLSNHFFKLWLDSKMMYSSAIYDAEHTNLESAAEFKLKTICEKLQLKESDHVLEIGTGWGGFAIYAAENYGCKVTTTTISQEQFSEAQQRIKEKGLNKKITLLQNDYRELSGEFDKLVSIEMIEAVGHQYLDTYFQACSKHLKADGLGLIQAITVEDNRYETALKTVDFIKRYIFPGSFIPCNRVMIDSAAKSGLKLIDLEDIGLSYAQTLHDWRALFWENIETIKAQGFDERFIRMWDFYLAYCEGGFQERVISDVQLLFLNSMEAK